MSKHNRQTKKKKNFNLFPKKLKKRKLQKP